MNVCHVICVCSIVFHNIWAFTSTNVNAQVSKEVADDTFTKLLNRVEYLESRDQFHETQNKQQQREIDSLRNDLQTLKREAGDKDLIIQKHEEELLRLARLLNDKDAGKTPTMEAREYNDEPKNGMEQETVLEEGPRPRFRRYLENEVTVAFYAQLSGTVTHLGQNQNIVFDNILTNVGAAYNHIHGIFTTPVAGIYVFSTTVMTETTTDSHVGIDVNGQILTRMKLYGTAHAYDTISQTAIFQLKQGDVVSIKHTEVDKSIHGGYTYFSGFLLQQEYTSSTIVG